MARAVSSCKVVYNHFPAIAKQLPGIAVQIIGETLGDIDLTVKTGMIASGGGRVYRRGNRIHIASAPGQMPAIDMEQLISSLSHQIIRGQYKGYYYTDTGYAVFLEYGTSKMAARPFMTPAAEQARPRFLAKWRNLESRLR